MNKIGKPSKHIHFRHLFTVIFLVFILPQLLLASTIQSKDTQSSPSINDKLLWGTYKPHLISAVTQRSTHPITVGMAYSNNKAAYPSLDSFKDKLRFRMNRGIFAQYTHHNGIDFSRQAIFDDAYNLFYDTAFIKEFSSADPTLQQWTYKIYGAEQEQKQISEKQPFYTFLYIALEDLEGSNQDSRQIQIVENLEQDDSIILKVTDSKTGVSSRFFRVSITGSKDKKDGSNTVKGIYRCLISDKDKTKTWNVEDIIQSRLKTNIFKGAAYLDPIKCQGDPNNVNFVVIQVTATSAFEIVTTYNSKEVPQFDRNKVEETILKREQSLEASLEAKLPVTGLNKYKLDLKEAREIQRFAVSNLLGGILYSYGGIKIDSPYDKEYGTEGTKKMELFTGSPSRFGFPRGFLWDEGFHETVICKWDAELCMEIIKSWFNTMQVDGWIPREQARGEELESNFKQKEFLKQTPLEANPPSMILPLLELVDKASKSHSESSQKIRSFLVDILFKLKKWLYWFVKSQLNDFESSGHFFESLDNKPEENQQYYFRWSCKDPSEGKYFASGLDDYPRNFQDEQPTGNIDLHSWLLVVANGILSIEDFLQHQRSADILKLENHLRKSFANFIDPKENLVKDFALQYEHGDQEEEEQEQEGPLTNPIGKIFAPYQGYVNLFPIFFGNLEPNSPELKATLDIIGSPEKLWTQYGIRSLSKSDAYFMEVDGYWTEPIWMPMNFLLLRGLKKFYSDNEEAQQIYRALRENLVKTMSMNWKMDLYLWENYDSFTGVGKGFPGFTGWTSLMALIYAEQY